MEKSFVCFCFLIFGFAVWEKASCHVEIKLFIMFIKDFFFFFFDASHLMMQSDHLAVFLNEQLAWIYPKIAKIILLCNLK